MIINLGKKFELLPAAPDIYGRVEYFVSNGDVMSPKSYPKLVAELVCAAWNGDDSKFYDVYDTEKLLSMEVDKLDKEIDRLESLLQAISYAAGDDKKVAALCIEALSRIYRRSDKLE